jgi:large subunit ribosomal protein L3
MGRKRGMTQLFDEKGNNIPCTVIEVQPNVITQVKTGETDGYDAIQLGFETIVTKDPRTVEKRVTKPLRGHFAKNSIAPRRFLNETRLKSTEGFTVGQEIGVDSFDGVTHVDVAAMSKGKGYQGVIKLHNYSGGPASHGSGFHRHAGSTGMRTSPGRGLPGGKKASHMGYDRKTVQNLKVIKIDAPENIIVVKGQVPGPRNGLVYITEAKKKMRDQSIKKTTNKKS